MSEMSSGSDNAITDELITKYCSQLTFNTALADFPVTREDAIYAVIYGVHRGSTYWTLINCITGQLPTLDSTHLTSQLNWNKNRVQLGDKLFVCIISSSFKATFLKLPYVYLRNSLMSTPTVKCTIRDWRRGKCYCDCCPRKVIRLQEFY